MNPETIKSSLQAVADGLTPLAQKLKIPLDGLWQYALWHNYALAALDLFYTAVGVIGLIIGCKMVQKKVEEIYDVNGWIVGGIFIIILGISLIFGFVGDVFPRLIAPQWSTAQDLINLVKGQ